MIKVPDAVMKEIFAHAAEVDPQECCGMLVRVGRKITYFPCKNVATDKSGIKTDDEYRQENFEHDTDDQCAAEDAGKPLAIVHSHPDALPKPTIVDRLECEKHELPWLIVGRDNEFEWLEPTGYTAPLLGRQFVHGVLDCYQAISDFYAREFGILLGHYDRNDRWWENKDGPSLYLDNFEKEGFTRVDTPRRGDILIMRIKTPGLPCYHPNHAGVFLGDNPLLKSEAGAALYGTGPFFYHHLYGRLANREIYGNSWATRTELILRHESMM